MISPKRQTVDSRRGQDFFHVLWLLILVHGWGAPDISTKTIETICPSRRTEWEALGSIHFLTYLTQALYPSPNLETSQSKMDNVTWWPSVYATQSQCGYCGKQGKYRTQWLHLISLKSRWRHKPTHMGKTHSAGQWEPKHSGYLAHLGFVVSVRRWQQQLNVK